MVAALQIQSTRQQILEYLRRHGRATVKELGGILDLTSTGIRQHLTVLERDGLVEAREQRGRVGRPTLVYSLTEEADALFPKTYDALASVLLEEIRSSEGNERLHELLRQVAERMAAPYVERMEGKSLGERVEETARIMEEQGCVVDYRQENKDYYIDEFTCPLSKVAQQDHAVCVLHVDFIRILTGADTRLSESLLRGQRACSHRIRGRGKGAAST